MNEKRYNPDPTRVSILTAVVLLAFALTRVISAPHYDFTIALFGLYLTLSLNLDTLIVLLAAGVTAAGVDWLLRTHPSLEKGETREHWLAAHPDRAGDRRIPVYSAADLNLVARIRPGRSHPAGGFLCGICGS